MMMLAVMSNGVDAVISLTMDTDSAHDLMVHLSHHPDCEEMSTLHDQLESALLKLASGMN